MRVRRLALLAGGLAAASLAVPASAPDPVEFVFDRPFLVAVRRADAAQPCFLLWVGSTDVLVPTSR